MNKLRIAIPTPCDQKYNSFTPTSKGGFCSSCEKEVIDFTSWSDERIRTYFKELKGNTCGRFREDQLKAYSYDNRDQKGISWVSFLFAGFLLLFSSRQVSAQTAPTRTTEQYEPEFKKENIKTATPAKVVTVFGTVTSRDDGQVIPGVRVRLKGTSKETLTNAEGKFSLDLQYSDSTQLIVFSFPGLKTVEYIHNTTRPGQEIAVDMEREVFDVSVLAGKMGGVSVGRRVEPREFAKELWWLLTGR
jgi:hypothetical protein